MSEAGKLHTAVIAKLQEEQRQLRSKLGPLYGMLQKSSPDLVVNGDVVMLNGTERKPQ